MTPLRTFWKRNVLVGHFTARPRFYGAALIGLIIHRFWPSDIAFAARLLMSWDVSVVLYLTLIFLLMLTARSDEMTERTRTTDEGRLAVLFLSVLASVASFVATVVVLSEVKHGGNEWFDVSLSTLTILLSWAFIHTIFTELYAHEYYRQVRLATRDANGLLFPDPVVPNYVDFLYFAFTIGVANQTADIGVNTRSMRGLVMVHSVISYIFNTFILAMTINIAANIL